MKDIKITENKHGDQREKVTKSQIHTNETE